MKKNIHPAYHQTKAICACGNSFQVGSTISEAIKVEVCYLCHPFYTGKQKLIDSTGRVDRFKRRTKMAETLQQSKKIAPDTVEIATESAPAETVSETVILPKTSETITTEFTPTTAPRSAKKVVVRKSPVQSKTKESVKSQKGAKITGKKKLSSSIKKVPKKTPTKTSSVKKSKTTKRAAVRSSTDKAKKKK